jgi:chromosome segregation ATPase
MNKFTFILLSIGVLSGCASNVRNDVSLYEQEISNSAHDITVLKSSIAKHNQNMRNYKSSISESNDTIRNSKAKLAKSKLGISKSKRYLSENSDIFVGGRCIRPSLGSKPEPYCETQSEAKEHGLAYCSMSAGCDAAMYVASDELDTFSKRFLASEACSRMVSELKNEGYSSDATAVNALEALSDTGCSNESSGFWSAIGKGLGCMMSASIKIAKIQSYVNCTERKANTCYSSYTNWKDKPEKRKNECLTNVRSIATHSSNIPQYERNIISSLNAVQKNEKNIENSSKSIFVAKKELESKQARNEKYARLLAERKKTIAYKLYGE